MAGGGIPNGWQAAIAAVVGALASACSDGEPGVARDAAVDAAVDAELRDAAVVPPPDLPEEPAPPVLTPCPPGWSETPADLGVVTCEPWPAGTDLHCPPGEAWFPGAPGCERLGPECPEDGWPADLPAEGVVYVSAGAKSGIGTRERPFGAVGEAVDAAGEGETIAVAVGTYDEVVTLRRGVSIRGACVTGTVWTSSISSNSAALTVVRGASDIQNVGFSDLRSPAIDVTGVGAALSLTDVAVDGATFFAIEVLFSAHLDASRLAVRDTVPRVSDGYLGRAVDLEVGGTAELRQVVVLDNADGIFVDGSGSELTAQDLAIVGSRSDQLGSGRGMNVQVGAVATVQRAVLEDNQGVGVHAGGAGASATFEDVVIRDTLAVIEDAVPDTDEGRGVNLMLGAEVRMTRCTVERNREAGVHATDGGSRVRLDDVVVRDTSSEAVREVDGPGVQAQQGGAAELHRVLVARNHHAGVVAAEGGSLLLDDVRVADTRGRALDGGYGVGILIMGSVAQGHRVRAERNRTAGIEVSDGPSSLVLEDVAVLETAGRPDQRGGNALYAGVDATVELTRVLLQDDLEVALYATGGARVTARHATIADTRARACADSGCAAEPAGHGVGAYDAATVVLERFALLRSALCGVQLAAGGEVDLHEGSVEGNGIGACVQVPEYDLARLTGRVVFGEGQVVETTSLPLPEPAPPLD